MNFPFIKDINFALDINIDTYMCKNLGYVFNDIVLTITTQNKWKPALGIFH